MPIVTMKPITKADVPRVRAIIAQKFPAERVVYRKWNEVNSSMGSLPLPESIRGLKIVVFLCKKTEEILVDEIAHRGQEGTLRALDRLDEIKAQATELLSTLA